MTTTEAPPLDISAVAAGSVPADVPPVPTTKRDETTVPATPESNGVSGGPAADSSAKRRPGIFPPRATPRPDKRPAKPPREPKSSATLKRHVTELYTAAGMMVLPFDQPCGTVVVNSADQCADALVKLSEENETVRKILEGMVQTSAIGAVLVAHMPIIMAIMAHHVAPDRSLFSDPNVVPFHTPQQDITPPPDDEPTVVRDTAARPRRPGPARVRPTR